VCVVCGVCKQFAKQLPGQRAEIYL